MIFSENRFPLFGIMLAPPSFRDAPLGAGPESIRPVLAFICNRQDRGYGFRVRSQDVRAPEWRTFVRSARTIL